MKERQKIFTNQDCQGTPAGRARAPKQPGRTPRPPAPLPVLAHLTAGPNGMFQMKAQVLDCGLDVWITPSQARKILGIERPAIYRLVDADPPLLISKRPLRRKILVSLHSVRALSEATKDPEFWYSKELQDRLREKLKKIPGSKI